MAFFDEDLNVDFNADDELDVDTEDRHYGGTEARVFLIDAHQRMFAEAAHDGDEDGERRSCFMNALNSVLVSIQRRVFSSNASLYAVVLYGTKINKNPNSFVGVHVLQDLDLVDPDRIRELESLIRDSDNFSSTLGHAASEASLGDALWMASHLFAGSRTRLGEKSVFLFTNGEDPHAADPAARRKALTKAADLKELGVDLTVLPLRSAGEDFDVSAFYVDLLQLKEKDEVEDLRRCASSTWGELEARLRGLEDKRRRLAALPFHLGNVSGESLSFSVGLYSMVRERAEPRALVRSTRDNKTEVKTVTRKYLGGEEGDGELLIPSDIKKGISYAGKNVLFEEDELRRIKDFGKPGIRLLGFKPIDSLQSHHHIGPSSFLYPDESSTEGSSRLFVALHRKCHLKNKMAIVKIIPRQHTPPTMAALIPQKEVLDEHMFQTIPPGFWVKPLPFADDFRDLSSVMPEEDPDDVEESREITDRIIKKLTFRFNPRNFENPALQTMYGVIETMALDKNDPPEVEDATLPPSEKIDKKISALCEDWKQIVWPSGYNPTKPPTIKRPPASSGDSGTSPKKSKTEKEPIKTKTVQEMQEASEQNKVNKLTIPILKLFCKENSIVSKGTKKDDFVRAINEYFGIE